MWDHRPAASELLERRLALGWRPIPTLLRTGERVLGYAACAVTTTPHRSSGPRRVGEGRALDADTAT